LEDLIEVLKEIRDGIYQLNGRVDNINDSLSELKGYGVYNSLSDIHDQLEKVAQEIKGDSLYNNLSDVCNKLDDISSALHSIDLNTM